MHEKIVSELENGIVVPETKAAFLRIAEEMRMAYELDGLILGCTELPMIINEQDTDLLLLNTTEIHVDAMINTLS